jgi:ribosomal protein S18 acetylase RimI-like enzyme
LFSRMGNYFQPWVLVERYFLSFHNFILYESDLDNLPLHVSKLDMNIRKADVSDLKKLAEVRTNEKTSGEHKVNKQKYLVTMLNRLKSGHCCFLAEKNDHFLGYVWVAFRELSAVEMNRTLVLDDKSVIIYDLYTFSAYRGLGVAPNVTEKALRHLKNNSIEQAYAVVDTQNKPSIVANEKNFKTIDAIKFINFFGYSYVGHQIKYAHIKLAKFKKY